MRSSVIETPDATRSKLPWSRAAKMPSQPVVTNSAWQLILAQTALTTSTSKPTTCPVAGSMLSIGGEVVSEPTFSSLPPRSAA
ncbi:hypothetical protein N183_29240 [Sinorhizobium sp. Sb3]|nr:hypothetical protein N183_29240 [Sinorhizobium sp. Sb3]